jgi:hypothetical protein
MKRWLILGVAILLISYIIAYRFLPFRDATRFRNAEVFVHFRDFHYEWEARLFYPAACVEWLLIRAYPRPWLPHPSWTDYPQVLLLQGYEWRTTFPSDVFRK